MALTVWSSVKYNSHLFPDLLCIITCSCVILIPQESTSFHKLKTSASSAPTGLAENSMSNVKPYLALLANGCTGISTYELPVINN